ncbi:MAG TPA: alpha/beta hydrolase [Candidatus Sulfotelmatobacter sp.]|nr:alpha/beta hydrolase [Candidatus Sulfotelmatobacter sp.]
MLLVHGGSGDHRNWDPVLVLFTPQYRVCALDRRGHGKSGDNPEYSLDNEIGDVVAAVNAMNGPVILVAHSFGAICAAEAALRSPRVSKLVLYEPPIPIKGPIASTEALAKFEDLVRSGQSDAALEMFLREIVKLPEARIASARKDPSWTSRAKSIGVQVREVRAVNGYKFRAEQFQKLLTPTLLMTGSETAEHHRIANDVLARTLPNRTLVVLQGQGHDGIRSAPELFAESVLKFLKSGTAK